MPPSVSFTLSAAIISETSLPGNAHQAYALAKPVDAIACIFARHHDSVTFRIQIMALLAWQVLRDAVIPAKQYSDRPYPVARSARSTANNRQIQTPAPISSTLPSNIVDLFFHPESMTFVLMNIVDFRHTVDLSSSCLLTDTDPCLPD